MATSSSSKTRNTGPSVQDIMGKAPASAPAEPTEAPTPVEPPADKPKRRESPAQIRNRLRNQAERIVLDRHRDEFHQEATKLFEANGLEFKHRLTETERAQAKIEALLRENPELRERFAPTTVVVDQPAED